MPRIKGRVKRPYGPLPAIYVPEQDTHIVTRSFSRFLWDPGHVGLRETGTHYRGGSYALGRPFSRDSLRTGMHPGDVAVVGIYVHAYTRNTTACSRGGIVGRCHFKKPLAQVGSGIEVSQSVSTSYPRWPLARSVVDQVAYSRWGAISSSFQITEPNALL